MALGIITKSRASNIAKCADTIHILEWQVGGCTLSHKRTPLATSPPPTQPSLELTHFYDSVTDVELGGGAGRGCSAALAQPVQEEELVRRVHLSREVGLSHRRVWSVGDVGQVVDDRLRKPTIIFLMLRLKNDS